MVQILIGSPSKFDEMQGNKFCNGHVGTCFIAPDPANELFTHITYKYAPRYGQSPQRLLRVAKNAQPWISYGPFVKK